MSDGDPTVVELRIDAIAAGGDGVGRDPDGRAVFVPLTAPGDRVRADIVTEKPKWARGRLRQLLEPAPERVEPPCPVYGVCGGCRLQHLDPDRQATAKRAIVGAALRRIGKQDVDVPELIRAGDPFGYRNRVTLTVHEDRAGFHGLNDPGEVVDCPNCLLAEPAVQEAWEALAPFDMLPTGGELRVTIRASADGRIALLVEGGREPGDRQAVADALPNLESYVWVDDERIRCQLAGRATFADTWQGLRFELDPTVFLQVNRAVSDAMDAWLDERLYEAMGPQIDGIGLRNARSLSGVRVADLYAGVGVRAIRWARAGARVVACEVDPAACRSGAGAARLAGAKVTFRQGKVEDHLGLLDSDFVVVNPPRAGLSERVRARLAAAPARHVAYVSCDPATLARDLQRLAEGYDVTAIQPFDAFPQTAHVETIVWLDRREEPAEAAT